MAADPYDDPEFRAFAAGVRESLIPKLEASSISVSLVAENSRDVKFAVELGMSILLDKPILAVVVPGTKVSAKLIAVADEIVELVGEPNTWQSDPRNGEAVSAALDRMKARGR